MSAVTAPTYRPTPRPAARPSAPVLARWRGRLDNLVVYGLAWAILIRSIAACGVNRTNLAAVVERPGATALQLVASLVVCTVGVVVVMRLARWASGR